MCDKNEKLEENWIRVCNFCEEGQERSNSQKGGL